MGKVGIQSGDQECKKEFEGAAVKYTEKKVVEMRGKKYF